MAHVQIKIFEHAHPVKTPQHFDELEQEMNAFLLTLDAKDVLLVDYKYLNLSPSATPVSVRCDGFVVYKI